MSLYPSMESIRQQVRSPLGTAIAGAMQQVIDFKRRLPPNTKPGDIMTEVRAEAILRVGPVLKDAILKHMGIDIAHVNFGHQNLGNMAVYTLVDNKETQAKIQAIMDGYRKRIPDPLKTLDELAKAYDPDDGKLNREILDKLSKKEGRTIRYQMVVIINPSMFFCTNEMLGVKNLIDFTADEITGIILHEVGHCATNMEFYATQFEKYLTIEACNLLVGEKGTYTDQLKALKILKQATQNIVPENDQDKLDNSGSDELIKQSESELDKQPGWLRKMFLSLMLYFRKKSILKLQLKYLSRISKPARGKLSWEKKETEFATDHFQTTTVEYLSDEFVVRNGFSVAFSSALEKMNHVYKLMGLLGATRNPISRQWMANKLMSDMLFTSMHGESSPGREFYGSYMERQESLLQSLYRLFVDQKAPPELTNLYLQQVAEIRKTVEEYKKVRNTFKHKFFMLRLRLIDKLARRERIKDLVEKDEKFQEDYLAALQIIDNLQANEMLYHAANIRRILQDKA